MKPFRIFVELQNSDYVQKLEQQVKDLTKRLNESEKEEHKLGFDAYNELLVNLELTDLLRANGIDFRPSADLRSLSGDSLHETKSPGPKKPR